MKNTRRTLMAATTLVGLCLFNAAQAQIFVANNGTQYGDNTGEYTTAGATVNASLITGLDYPYGVDVEEVPEPSTWALLVGGLGGWLLWRWRASRTFV
jgi:hypothetical protein